MLRDITFGKYYNTQSVIHELDGRTNLLRFVVFFVSILISKSPQGLVFATVFLLITIVLSRIPLQYILKGVWGVRYYIFLCVLLSLISDHSKAGHIKALTLSFKMFLCVVSASLYTLTTSVSHISDTFEWVLSPLKIFNVPVRDVAVMISIALRFIPVLSEEASNIVQAQRARGANIGKGSFIRKAKNIIPLIIPIFTSAIRRAEDLSEALSTRAYGLYEERTRLNPLKFKKNDFYALLCMTVYIGLIFWGNKYAH